MECGGKVLRDAAFKEEVIRRDARCATLSQSGVAEDLAAALHNFVLRGL
jgi:hypothetical protein